MDAQVLGITGSYPHWVITYRVPETRYGRERPGEPYAGSSDVAASLMRRWLGYFFSRIAVRKVVWVAGDAMKMSAGYWRYARMPL